MRVAGRRNDAGRNLQWRRLMHHRRHDQLRQLRLQWQRLSNKLHRRHSLRERHRLRRRRDVCHGASPAESKRGGLLGGQRMHQWQLRRSDLLRKPLLRWLPDLRRYRRLPRPSGRRCTGASIDLHRRPSLWEHGNLQRRGRVHTGCRDRRLRLGIVHGQHAVSAWQLQRLRNVCPAVRALSGRLHVRRCDVLSDKLHRQRALRHGDV